MVALGEVLGPWRHLTLGVPKGLAPSEQALTLPVKHPCVSNFPFTVAVSSVILTYGCFPAPEPCKSCPCLGLLPVGLPQTRHIPFFILSQPQIPAIRGQVSVTPDLVSGLQKLTSRSPLRYKGSGLPSAAGQ